MSPPPPPVSTGEKGISQKLLFRGKWIFNSQRGKVTVFREAFAFGEPVIFPYKFCFRDSVVFCYGAPNLIEISALNKIYIF